MSEVITRYQHAIKALMNGTVDWSGDTIKLALLSNAYTPSESHTEFSQVSGSELTADNGYTSGGEALANKTIENEGLFADPVIFPTLTKNFRFGVLYKVGLANGLTDPLLAYILWDSTNIDRVISGVPFGVYWPATGVVRFS